MADQEQQHDKVEQPGGASQKSDSAMAGRRLPHGGDAVVESVLTTDDGGTRMLAAVDAGRGESADLQKGPDMPQGTLSLDEVQRLEEIVEAERMGHKLPFMDQRTEGGAGQDPADRAVPTFGYQGGATTQGPYLSNPAQRMQQLPRRDIFSFAPLNSGANAANAINTLPLSEGNSGQIIKGSMVNPPHRFASREGEPDRASPSKAAYQRAARKGQSETAFHQLVRAQKLAVSTKRQVEITDKLHSNHIKMSESQQTYNPYHLSSYNAQQPTDKSSGAGGPGTGYHYRGIPIRDGLAADGLILHQSEAVSEPQSPRAAKPSDQRSLTGTNYNPAPNKQKSALNFSTEIRKQSRKRQEFAQKYKSQKRPEKERQAAKVVQKPDRKVMEAPAQSQPGQRIFGVQGERARFNPANYAQHLGREQMYEIAHMQEELEQNLKRLQHQKECQAHRAKNKYFGPRWEKDARQAVYRMDPGPGKAAARPPKSQPSGQGALNNRIAMKRQARGPGGKSLGAYEDSAAGAGLARASSHASSHQRRIEAQRALQTFVIKENLSPNEQSDTAMEGAATYIVGTGEPGSPANPLVVPTVDAAAGALNIQAGAADPLFGFEMANKTAVSAASGELMAQRGLELAKENKMRQLGLEKSGNKHAPSVSGQNIYSGQRQIEDEYHVVAGPQQPRKPDEKIEKTGDSRKSKVHDSQRQSSSSMQVGWPRQSGYSRKRSSGQGSGKLQAIGNMQDRQWYSPISDGQKGLGMPSQIQDHSQNGQRQAIYSSYNLQRIDKNGKPPQSTDMGAGSKINVNKSQRNAPRASRQQPAKLVAMSSDVDGKNVTVKSTEPPQDSTAKPQPNGDQKSTNQNQKRYLSPGERLERHRDSLISMAKGTEQDQKNQGAMMHVDTTVDIEIFDKSKKLDKTISPAQQIQSMSPQGEDESMFGEKGDVKSGKLVELGEVDQQQVVREVNDKILVTPLPIQASVIPESEATIKPKSPDRSPGLGGADMNGTRLLADAMEEHQAEESTGQRDPSQAKAQPKAAYQQEPSSKLNDRSKLRPRPTEDTLAFSDFRVKSQERGLTLEPRKAGGPTIFEANQEDPANPQSETTEIMVLSGGTNTGLFKGDLMVKGAKLGAVNHFYNDACGETPLTRDAAGTNAASTSLFNARKLNPHLLTSGTGLRAINANIRSQDQLRARRVQRRFAGYGHRAGQVKTGMSSQIHIHDHILNKSQGRGTNLVDALIKGQMSYGQPSFTVQNHARARKLLASQGRSGGAAPAQKWPTVLIAVKTDDRYLGREQMSLQNKELGDEFNHILGQASEQLRNVKSSKDALYFNEEQHFEDQLRPQQRELRKLLDAKDRKKVQFRPAPSRLGLKFKNKSEEDRYMKVVTKILQMEHMSKPQIERTLISVRKFLKEYLLQIHFYWNSPTQKGRRIDVEPDDIVEQWMITKFIWAIKGMNNQESTLSDGGNKASKNFAGMSRLSAEGPSKLSASRPDGPAQAGYQTGMGVGTFSQTPIGFSEEFQHASQAESQRPVTQGRQRTNQPSLIRNEISQIGSPQRDQPQSRGTKGISIQNFIRKMLGLKKRGQALNNYGGLAGDNRSVSPSKHFDEADAKRDSDVTSANAAATDGGKREEQRNWANESPNDFNLSSGAEDAPGLEQDDEASSGSEKTWARWDHNKLFPPDKWTDPKQVDPAQIYDGRRRDGCRPLHIPSALLHRNYHLDQYIDNNTKHGQYETLLQTVLTSAYYSLKQQNRTDQTILNRLQSKNVMKNMMQRDNVAVPARSANPQTHLIQVQPVEDSKIGAAGSMGGSYQASRSQAMTIATHIHQTGGTQGGTYSRDHSAAVLNNETPHHGFVMHDPSDQPLIPEKMTLDINPQEESQRAGNQGVRVPDPPGAQSRIGPGPGEEKGSSQRQRIQSMGSKIRSGDQGSAGFSVLRGGEDHTTQALKNQSVIRRNGLMLEHIMRQRGQQNAESRVLAELYEELRNIEKREGTYSYKGATLMPGQRGEPKPEEEKYLLVQVVSASPNTTQVPSQPGNQHSDGKAS